MTREKCGPCDAVTNALARVGFVVTFGAAVVLIFSVVWGTLNYWVGPTYSDCRKAGWIDKP